MIKVVKSLNRDKTCFDLKDLRGEIKYEDFQLIAVTNFSLRSDPARHPDVLTEAPHKLQLLQKEILWAESSSYEYVDTDFFQPGVIQREYKVTYLAKLKEELLKLRKDPSFNKECDENSNLPSSMDHITSQVSDRRERNFYYRIQILQSQIQECKESIEQNLTSRALISSKMARAQENIQSYRQELKRIADVDDEFIHSNTLHSSEQQFRTVELRAALQHKLDDELASIESWKILIVEQDESNSRLSTLLGTREEQLRDRKAALLIFKKQKDSSSMNRMQKSLQPMDVASHCFQAWLSSSKKLKGKTSAVRFIHNCRCRSVILLAISVWRNKTKRLFKIEQMMKDKLDITSKGGMQLVQTELASIDMCNEIKSAMLDFHNISVERNSTYENGQTNRIPVDSNADLFALVRGDYHYQAEEYKSALHCYKSVLRTLQTTTNDPKKTTQIQYNIIDKIGRSLVHVDSLNEAILAFDFLLRSVTESKDEKYQRIANLRLGDCYYLTRDLRMAKKHYAQCLNHDLSHIPDEIYKMANVSIQACDQPHEYFLPSIKSEKSIAELEAGDRKILKIAREACERAEQLKFQIGNTSTVAGFNIKMEKVTCKCVLARNKYSRLNQDIMYKKGEQLNVQKELIRLPQLISNIQNELHATPKQSEKGDKIMSSLVHDNIQYFEENELLQRLQLRLNESLDELHNAKRTDHLLAIQIRNIQDEMNEIQEDLSLESSELVQRILRQRSIRLIGFDKISISNGEHSQPQKMLVALTIDKDLYIHDAMTGQALQAFEGYTAFDSNSQSSGHTSTITCLYFEGTYVFTGALDQSLRCWNLESNSLYFVGLGHESTITSICTNTSSAFSGSSDKTIMVWNKKTGQQLHRLSGHTRGVLCLSYGSGGLVSGDGDGDILIWEDESVSYDRRYIKAEI